MKILRKYLHDKRVIFARWRVHFRRENKLLVLSIKRKFQFLMTKPLGRKPNFLIGPTNSANQGTAWSQALTRFGANSESLRISANPAGEWFTTDISIPREKWLTFDYRQELANSVASSKEIVLIESLRPIFLLRNVRDSNHQVLEDFTLLTRIGKRAGVIFHGSDIRDVDAHALRNPYSPFKSERPEIEDLRKRSNQNRAILPELRNRGLPIFVSTKDLLLEVPDAHWLPVTIDFPRFNAVAKSSPIYTGADTKLRVLFLPSRSWLKSAELIEPVLLKLVSEGIISYESFTSGGENIKHDQIPDLIAKNDVVIDQYLGVIGVFPIEALAAGRIVLSYVPEADAEIPIISITPQTLESELRRIAKDRPLPHGGVEYAERWHDGRESVKAIAKVFNFRV